MEVTFTAWAENCLREIYKYYCEEVSPEKAYEIVDQIIDKANSLEQYPNRGGIEEDLQELKKEHRYLLQFHYKIIYRVDTGRVMITDIFSTRQDPIKKGERKKPRLI